jgi:hypothetical protein
VHRLKSLPSDKQKITVSKSRKQVTLDLNDGDEITDSKSWVEKKTQHAENLKKMLTNVPSGSRNPMMLAQRTTPIIRKC